MEDEQPPNVLKCTDVATEYTKADDRHVQLVLNVVRQDMLSADLRWSLFVAASQNYRRDSCLRPFPPMFLMEGNKDFSALEETIEVVPAFRLLESSIQTLPNEAVELLHWVLVEMKEPSLTVVNKSEVGTVLEQVSCELSAPAPALVLRVGHEPASGAERRWDAVREHTGAGTIHAFHGSKVENFHSILHHGLQQHMTKNALFGQGVYLSSELLVCLPYSRTGLGWSHSCIGSHLSIVALCELLDHPTINCQTQGNKERARAEDSEVGEVPHKLYLVPNSELVRVSYLLVYPAHTATSAPNRLSQHRSSMAWLGRHKVAIWLVAYAALLAAVGLSRNQTALRLWRHLCHSLGMH